MIVTRRQQAIDLIEKYQIDSDDFLQFMINDYMGGGELLGGGGEGEGGGSDMDELINEIKGLRADLAAGKIAVNMDGASVTARVSSHVERSSKNSYAKT